MMIVQRLSLAAALALPLASCTSINGLMSSMQPELTPGELSVLEATAGCTVTPIKHYVEVDGTLGEGDCLTRDGRFVDYYGLRSVGSSRTEYGTVFTTFRMSSDELDSFLSVRTKGRFRDDVRSDDDSGDGLDAYLSLPLHDDVFLIEVTSKGPGPAAGSYRLVLSRTSPSPR